MIKLFRNIRRKLIVNNKASQYLLYALGEIILVVIGILIALKINNWNEQRNDDIRDRIMLAQLREEIASNREQLMEDMDSRKSQDRQISNFLNYLRADSLRMDLEKCRRYLAVLSNAESYTFSENYLQSYIGSTQQENSEITRELVALHAYQNDLNYISEKSLDHRLENFYSYLGPEVDFYNLAILSTNRLSSLEFKNKVVLIKALESEVTNQYFRTLAQQQRVDSLIAIRLMPN